MPFYGKGATGRMVRLRDLRFMGVRKPYTRPYRRASPGRFSTIAAEIFASVFDSGSRVRALNGMSTSQDAWEYVMRETHQECRDRRVSYLDVTHTTPAARMAEKSTVMSLRRDLVEFISSGGGLPNSALRYWNAAGTEGGAIPAAATYGATYDVSEGVLVMEGRMGLALPDPSSGRGVEESIWMADLKDAQSKVKGSPRTPWNRATFKVPAKDDTGTIFISFGRHLDTYGDLPSAVFASGLSMTYAVRVPLSYIPLDMVRVHPIVNVDSWTRHVMTDYWSLAMRTFPLRIGGKTLRM